MSAHTAIARREDRPVAGPVVYLLPVGESRGEGFRNLVADLLGDAPKRRYSADPKWLSKISDLGLGWRLGAQPSDPLEVRPLQIGAPTA